MQYLQSTLLQLKGQQESIEQLVDNVVQGYHSGFNKAIHNYSHILQLFSSSKDQVTVKEKLPALVSHFSVTNLCYNIEYQVFCPCTKIAIVRLLFARMAELSIEFDCIKGV